MRKFWKKLFVFMVIYMAAIGVFILLSADEKLRLPIAELTNSNEYTYEEFGPNEIIPYIERVQEQNEYTKLVLGDSVCNQIFERYYDLNDEYCICGTNQAISIAGQYILAEEFVKNHKEVTDIYLVIIMDSLATEYSAQLGYQYAVMPFVETGTIKNLDENTRKEISDMYGYFFCLRPVVEIVHKSPMCMKIYLNLLDQKDKIISTKSTGLVSDVTYQYLIKFKELCDYKGIRFHLIPGPHADNSAQHQREERIRGELKTCEVYQEIENYLDQIPYYPEDLFRDRIHFDENKLEDDFFDELASTLLPDIKVR